MQQSARESDLKLFRTCSGPQADLHAAQGRNTRGDAATGSCLMEAVVCGSFLQFFPGLSAAVSAC